SEQKKMPATRLGVAAVLRDQLVKAQNYLEKAKKAAGNPEKMPERDLKMEALSQVIQGELPLRVHAHRADDIMTALRVADEFGLRVIIEHCTEGHKVTRELARRGVLCTVGPTFGARSKVEVREKSWRTPACLAEAGVKFAIVSDHPFSNVRFLPLFAGLAVREGLPEETALRAITIDAAALVGQESRVGSLEVGKDADLVVLSGHPFSLKTRTLYTVVNGELGYRG
ncbi:MAG: amidohydrolase family protein, partial [Firmicutes bacterium]|nr:amidohydrolase family protein [Bacillota bacterium]